MQVKTFEIKSKLGFEKKKYVNPAIYISKKISCTYQWDGKKDFRINQIKETNNHPHSLVCTEQSFRSCLIENY